MNGPFIKTHTCQSNYVANTDNFISIHGFSLFQTNIIYVNLMAYNLLYTLLAAACFRATDIDTARLNSMQLKNKHCLVVIKIGMCVAHVKHCTAAAASVV